MNCIDMNQKCIQLPNMQATTLTKFLTTMTFSFEVPKKLYGKPLGLNIEL